jgi:acetylornithine deacetylase/succinyl-diaminopimelate desuccinylase-like protein
MSYLEEVYSHIDNNFDKYVTALQTYLRQPSISAKGEGIEECASLTASFLKNVNAKVKIEKYDTPPPNPKYPIVYGKIFSNEKDAKTLIVYAGHYDVQPVEPLEEWESPPFAAEIRNEKIFARGAIDHKGPPMAVINAVDAIQSVHGEVPLNLIIIIEGEEEIGSPSLVPFVTEHKDEFSSADGVYYCGAGQTNPNKIRLSLGPKGPLNLEFEAKVRESNVHSGNKPILDSAALRLISALSSVVDDKERIIIDDFNENLKPPTEEEIELLNKLLINLDEDELRKKLGNTPKFRDELKGIELLKTLCFKPTFNVSGIKSGYVGPRFQNIVPAFAEARVDCRLPPEIYPDEAFKKIRRHLDEHGFSDIIVRKTGGYPWSTTPLNADIVKSLIKSYERLNIEVEIWPRSGGSSPHHVFSHPPLNLPVVSGGLGWGGGEHSPNEFIDLEGYRLAIKGYATFFMDLARKL